MKRNNKFIRKYNFHISNQKKMKRYITYLKNNIDNFSVVIKTENNIKANEIWYDVYEVGNWDLTISRIKKAFKNEFKSKFLQNPLIVEKKKTLENVFEEIDGESEYKPLDIIRLKEQIKAYIKKYETNNKNIIRKIDETVLTKEIISFLNFKINNFVEENESSKIIEKEIFEEILEEV